MSTPTSRDHDHPCDAVVMFGASGDLAAKKLLPALYELERAGRLDDGLPVVGVGRSEWDDDRFVEHARTGVDEHGRSDLDEDVFARLAGRLSFVTGDYGERDTFDRIAEEIGDAEAPLCYLAVPPSIFDTVIAQLSEQGWDDRGRVVVEKPFGRDLSSAVALNETLLEAFDEEQVLRIDHFLGKEELLDLLVLRFANAIFEPVWRRGHVSSVQITMAEDFGVEGRGGFYEQVGALRDVVQNHLLQVVALVAMEPPVDASARSLRDEKVKVLRSIRALDPDEVVRGQFDGYRDIEGVADDSDTDTFVALRLWIDNWRWAGIPFYIRSGKQMAVTATEILVEFEEPPNPVFRPADDDAHHRNHLILRMKPGERWTLGVQIKQPGEEVTARPVELRYQYDERDEGPREEAYERLLGDAIDGDTRLFARADAVEEAWRIVMPVVEDPPEVHPYDVGSWGPEAARTLIDADGGWHDPADDT